MSDGRVSDPRTSRAEARLGRQGTGEYHRAERSTGVAAAAAATSSTASPPLESPQGEVREGEVEGPADRRGQAERRQLQVELAHLRCVQTCTGVRVSQGMHARKRASVPMRCVPVYMRERPCTSASVHARTGHVRCVRVHARAIASKRMYEGACACARVRAGGPPHASMHTRVHACVRARTCVRAPDTRRVLPANWCGTENYCATL